MRATVPDPGGPRRDDAPEDDHSLKLADHPGQSGVMDEATGGQGRGTIRWLAWALIVTTTFEGWKVLWGILHLAIAVAKGVPVGGASDGRVVLASVVVAFLGIVALQWTAIALLNGARGAYVWLLCLCTANLLAFVLAFPGDTGLPSAWESFSAMGDLRSAVSLARFIVEPALALVGVVVALRQWGTGVTLGTSFHWTAAMLLALAAHAMLWTNSVRSVAPRPATAVRHTAALFQDTWPPTDVMFRPETEIAPSGAAHLVIHAKTWQGQPLMVRDCPARVFFSEVDTAREFTVRSRFESATIDLPRIDPGRYEVNVWLDVDQDPGTESNLDYFSIRRRHEGPEPHEIVLRDDGQTVERELPFERNIMLKKR